MLSSVLTLSAQKKGKVIDPAALKTADSVAIVDSKTIVGGKSVVVTDTAGSKKLRRDWGKWHPDSKKALWLAFIPGAGQIYNHKFWKLPIIYGGFLGCIYAWRWNGQMYNDYKQAYKDLTDDDPDTKSYEQFLHLGVTITDANKSEWISIFQKRKDKYRRWRDLSIICMVGVYAISIIDAYVDASLSEFDISNDLSLKITPTIINNGGKNLMSSQNIIRNSSLGVNCKLKF